MSHSLLAERATREDSRLRHVTIVEEAHRVMPARLHVRDRETSADTGAAASDLFSALLSEVRSLGEGVIVAEQIPSRLAADALKNTNTKIVHRLPGADDREAVAATMNMSPEGEQFLTKLRQGQAAVLVEGLERPAFIAIPDYRGAYKLRARVLDTRVAEHMAALNTIGDVRWPFEGCNFCQRRCNYRDVVGPLAFGAGAADRLDKAATAFRGQDSGTSRPDWASLAAHCAQAMHAARPDDIDAAYCYFSHLWRAPVTTAEATDLRHAIEEVVGGKR